MIIFDFKNKEIRICNDAGRLTRPVLRVKNNKITLKLTWENIKSLSGEENIELQKLLWLLRKSVVDLLLKNNDNSNRMYKAGVDQIDHHIPEKYTRGDIVKELQIT